MAGDLLHVVPSNRALFPSFPCSKKRSMAHRGAGSRLRAVWHCCCRAQVFIFKSWIIGSAAGPTSGTGMCWASPSSELPHRWMELFQYIQIHHSQVVDYQAVIVAGRTCPLR